MVSKSELKIITSLQQKKYRTKHGLFVAEGFKVVDELLQSDLVLRKLYTMQDDFSDVSEEKKQHITEAELKKMSFLKTPNKCLALFEIPDSSSIDDNGLVVALDDIRDPGNLGTIIRLCDWFGIAQLVCSKETVDCFNPKVVQASMGSITRVKISYQDLEDFLKASDLPIYGAFMDGVNVYQSSLPEQAILVMGNEANGIAQTTEQLIQERISIPRFGKLKQTESLNVATATAILLSEFRR